MSYSLYPLKAKSGSGVLFFSFDNGLIDYSSLTRNATFLVHKHLGLPVCVVTDKVTEDFFMADKLIRIDKDEASTQRFFQDFGQSASWYNMGRELALDLTPWQHTIVLDSDYLVMSKDLLKYVDAPLALSRSAYFIDSDYRHKNLQVMPMSHLPMYWATVMIFDALDIRAQMFFSQMKKIKKAWPYFSQMCGLNPDLYRNDYVATLSLAMLQQHRWSRDYDLPITLLTAGFDSEVTRVDYQGITINTKGNPPYLIKDIDIHVFNKKSLLRALINSPV